MLKLLNVYVVAQQTMKRILILIDDTVCLLLSFLFFEFESAKRLKEEKNYDSCLSSE